VAITDIDICARALVLIGASPITSFDEGTTESTVASNIYQDTVRDMLSRHRWRFASGQAQLSRLVDVPDAKWDAAYQLPADLLILHGVTITDNQIAFDRYQDKVYCNATTEDVVFADYTFQANEDLWPPYFVTAIQYQLASIFAYSVAAQEGLSDMFEKRAMRQMTIGRTIDSQSQTTRRFNVQRFNQIRTTTRGY
jgi:hypothetical protein